MHDRKALSVIFIFDLSSLVGAEYAIKTGTWFRGNVGHMKPSLLKERLTLVQVETISARSLR